MANKSDPDVGSVGFLRPETLPGFCCCCCCCWVVPDLAMRRFSSDVAPELKSDVDCFDPIAGGTVPESRLLAADSPDDNAALEATYYYFNSEIFRDIFYFYFI